jgi:NACHT domain
MIDMEDIRADIAAFADDENSVEIDKGFVLFRRDQVDYECQLFETSSGIVVESQGTRLPYRKFLAEQLGRLSILAQALIDKRRDVAPYIDTLAQSTNANDERGKTESALDSLWNECQSKLFGETKLLFLTADAGHGKTALLRRLTRRSAEDYISGKTDRLLFHIDTQGRSFIRLEEAVARDLGQLRMFGLFYPGVLTLVKHGLITLAIDGFDELLAEIGVGEAYSGLGSLLRQLKGSGVVVASARSAYFEVENYAAQTRLLTASPDTHVSVSQMRLLRWQREQSIAFFRRFIDDSGNTISDPEELYDHLESRLGTDHPVLHRPFLVYRMAALLAPNIRLADELAADIGHSGIQVVPKVILAMLRREVEEKWRDPSGQPYLTVDQHVLLLSAIADEMWIQGKTRYLRISFDWSPRRL